VLCDNSRVPAVVGILAGIGLIITITTMVNRAVPAKLFPSQTVTFTEATTEYKGLVFEKVINLSDTTQMHIPNTPGLAVSGRNVYVAWKEGPVDPGPDILFSLSSNSGNTFSDPVKIGTRASLLSPPQIAAFENLVYVVWEGTVPIDDGYNFQVFLRVSNDYGKTFGETLDMSKSKGEAREPHIAAEGEDVYLVWQDNAQGNNDIFLAKSSDQGKNFEKAANISNNSRDSNSPRLTISDAQLFVMWTDESYGNSDILLMKIPGEDIFSGNTVNLSKDREISVNPRLALADTHIYAIWESQGTPAPSSDVPIREIMFRSSDDYGTIFTPPSRLSINVIDPLEPNVAAVGESVYVVWAGSNPSGFHNIFFRNSMNGGESFAKTLNLQGDLTHHLSPKIVVNGESAYITWDNAGTADDQSFVITYDNADVFVNDTKFEGEPDSILSSNIVIADDRIYIAWDIDNEINLAAADI
jgi:hypothetical protein